MARIFTSGFELKSIPTATKSEGSEFWQWYAAGSNTVLSINTTNFNGGIASCRAFSATAVNAQLFASMGTASNAVYMEFDFRVDSYPSVNNAQIAFLEECETANFYSPVNVYLNTDGTMTASYQNDAKAQGGTTFATLSTPLQLKTWYRIGMYAKFNSTTSVDAEFRVNGKTIGTATAASILNNTATTIGAMEIGLGWGRTDAPNTAADYYFDNFTGNNTTGSYENTWPGQQIVVSQHPASDSAVAWTRSAGTTNYTLVNEVPPDDATSYVSSKTLNQEDLYTIGASGLGRFDKITCVQVGYRFIGAGASSNSTAIVEAKIGSNVISSTGIAPSQKAEWRTNADISTSGSVDARPYPVTMYLQPDNTTTWNVGALNSLIIGQKITAAATNAFWSTNIWTMVSYIPTTGKIFNYNQAVKRASTY